VTVQTRYFPFQTTPFRNPGRCAPRLIALKEWVLDEWGGQDLGCHVVRRIVGGTTTSTHAWGCAWDWRYEGPGPGMGFADSTAIPKLLGRSAEVGVQALHHYARSLIWRPPGTNGRPSGPASNGWRVQPKGSQMGQSWAKWLHIEIHLDAWDTIDIGRAMNPAPPPAPSKWPASTPTPTLKRGSRNTEARQLIDVMKFWGWYPREYMGDGNDGIIGARGDAGIKTMQRALRATSDGVYGPKTAVLYTAFVASMNALAGR